MVVYRKELRQGKIAFLVWTAVMCFFLGICIIIFPDMKEQMTDMSNIFGNMGSFSSAFGLDQINFGEFKGYFGVECGNIIGMFGAFYASYLGISALGKEEKEQTAEFLLTHPITRTRVVFEKALAIITEITVTNLCVMAVSYLLIYLIEENASSSEYLLLFLSYYLMQLQIAMITFAISAFRSRSDMGIGLGIGAIAYFMGIFSKLMEELEPVKYLTPFGYADSAYILSKNQIETSYLTVGMIILFISICIAFLQYNRKEIS